MNLKETKQRGGYMRGRGWRENGERRRVIKVYLKKRKFQLQVVYVNLFLEYGRRKSLISSVFFHKFLSPMAKYKT